MSDSNCRTCERTPTEVTYIENHWPHLQPHVREAIMTLVDGALSAGLVDRNGSGIQRSATRSTSRVGIHTRIN